MSLLIASTKPIFGLGPREVKIRFLGRPLTTQERSEGEDWVTRHFTFLRQFVSACWPALSGNTHAKLRHMRGQKSAANWDLETSGKQQSVRLFGSHG
jgi:hypothetical protein